MAGTIHGDSWVMTHLSMLDGLDGESLPTWSGPCKSCLCDSGPALTVSRSEAEWVVSPGGKTEERKRGITSIAFWALFGSKLVVILAKKERRCVSEVGCRPLATVHLICRSLSRHHLWPGSRSAVLPQLTLSHSPPLPPPLSFECQRLRQMFPQT